MAFVWPVVSFSCETWVLTASLRGRLRSWWHKIHRRLRGVFKWQHKRMGELLEECGSGDVIAMINLRRRRYLGHIFRYPDHRYVKQLLAVDWAMGDGPKKRGAPKTTWRSMVQKDLLDNDLDLRVKKEVWRKRIEELHWEEDARMKGIEAKQGKEEAVIIEGDEENVVEDQASDEE